MSGTCADIPTQSTMPQAQTDMALPLASSIRSPNPPLIRNPPILRLPVELTLIIFHHCGPDVKARLSLSHTCRVWRSITSGTSTLWTNIGIVVNNPAESRQFDNLMSLLEMQLDRAAGMPLDVVWKSNQTSGFDPRLMNLFRRKGPFSQWRTLQMGFRAVRPDDANIFHPGDAFSSLKSIVILPSVRTSIISILNLTTTSKLQALDHRPTTSTSEITLSDCTDMVGRIYRLTTGDFRISGLSSNITQLDTPYQSSHKFPHVKTYNIDICVLESDRTIDLRHLAILNISAVLLINLSTELSLPSLQHLTYGKMRMKGTAKITAPLLESLHILGHCPTGFPHDVEDGTARALEKDRFPLSPSSSLTVELTLPFNSILKLLERSPRIERVSLVFDNEECAVQALEHIGVAGSEDGSQGTRLCGRLKELRLTFLRRKSNHKSWKKHLQSWKKLAARVVKSRMENGVVLRIYAMWKGQGAYVLLA